MSIIQAIILAIIEGLTEFLPVSSTGHMVLASSFMGIASDDFVKFFTVAIQLGAILSVVILYFKRFFQSAFFYWKLFIAFIPAAIAGLLLSDQIDAMLENPVGVAAALLVGGIALLFVDKLANRSNPLLVNQPNTTASSSTEAEIVDQQPTVKKAFFIGCFQILALWPGVSRSAATIIGGMYMRLTKKAAAEFSFFLAVPTMFAATVKKGYDYIKDGNKVFSSEEINLLIVGNLVAFVVAMLAIRGFIKFLTRRGFKIFGYYRIALGATILILYFAGVNMEVV